MGDLQTFNRYSYVSNNPLSGTDPTGHVTQKEYQYYLDNRYTYYSHDGQGHSRYCYDPASCEVTGYESYNQFTDRVGMNHYGTNSNGTPMSESRANQENHKSLNTAREEVGCGNCTRNELWDIYNAGGGSDLFRYHMQRSYYLRLYSQRQRKKKNINNLYAAANVVMMYVSAGSITVMIENYVKSEVINKAVEVLGIDPQLLQIIEIVAPVAVAVYDQSHNTSVVNGSDSNMDVVASDADAQLSDQEQLIAGKGGGKRGAGSKGERRQSGHPSGSNDEFKHLKQDKNGRYYQKDNNTGKKKFKPKGWKPRTPPRIPLGPPLFIPDFLLPDPGKYSDSTIARADL